MDINGFKSKIKSGNPAGVYVFAGEEDYLVRHYLSVLRDAVGVDPAFAIFNNPTFDGAEIDYAALTDAVKSPPMMSDFKLIEWRHASFSSMREADYEAMEDLLKIASEYEYSVLAFTATADGLDFGTPKKPSRFVKTFGDRINLLRFDRSTENQLYSWLKKHFDAEGVSVSLDTLRALVFRSGRTMDVLKHEVEKLSALAHARGLLTITSEHVAEVCSSTPECDTFALSNAITDRSKPAAYTALEEMKNRRLDPMMAMGMIARTFDELAVVSAMLEEGRGAADIEKLLKINPYKLKIYVSASKRYGADRLASIVSTLARVDADSKFGGITGYTAVELFISQNL